MELKLTAFIIKNLPNSDQKHRIILEPFAKITVQELWLHKNPSALASVKKGLKQSAKKQTKSLGSFSEYLQESC